MSIPANISTVERASSLRNTGGGRDLTRQDRTTAAVASNSLVKCAICYEGLWSKEAIQAHGQPTVPHPDGGEKHPMHLRCFAVACKAMGNTCPSCKVPIEIADLEDPDLGEIKEEEEQPELLKPLTALLPSAPPVPGAALSEPLKPQVVLTPSAPPVPGAALSELLKPRVVQAPSAPPASGAALRPSAPRTAWWRGWLCWNSTDPIVGNLYPGSFGPQFYEDYFGGIALPVVPVPLAYIEASNRQDPTNRRENWQEPTNRREKIKDNFQLVFIPEFIRIVARANSSLFLNENGRLIEGPIAIGIKREIDVPVTLNNMAVLTEKYLRRGTPTGFELENSWSHVLADHVDTRIKSHWFYPRKEVIGLGESYSQQQVIAARAGLEITSLIDTAIYYLLRQIRSGNSERCHLACTSTSDVTLRWVKRENTDHWVMRKNSDPTILLRFLHQLGGGSNNIGAAVGVPAGTSQSETK